jgi:large subunit ribosomal protein L18
MADKNKIKQKQLERRKYNIRQTLAGSPERPRLSVFRSDKHISAQVVDDLAGKTLVSASSTQEDIRGDLKNGGNIEAAKRVGKAIAAKAVEAGIKTVAFDRNGRRYHGRIKALADAARAGGLSF